MFKRIWSFTISKRTRIVVIALPIATVLVISLIFFHSFSSMRNEYNTADKSFLVGNYLQAYEQFHALGRYRDSEQRAKDALTEYDKARALEELDEEKRAKYTTAVSLFENNDFEEAMLIFQTLGTYYDIDGHLPANLSKELYGQDVITCEQLAVESKYQFALQLLDTEEYELAAMYFTGLGDYRDSKTLLATATLYYMPEAQERVYNEAVRLFEDKQYNEALKLFEELESYNYEPAFAKADECRTILKRYALAQSYSAGGNFPIAITTANLIYTTFVPLQRYFESNVDLWKDVISIDIGDPLNSTTASDDWSLIVVGLTKDGRVICNSRYEIWFGYNMVQYTKPMPIEISDINNAVQVVAGGDHLAVLTADGTVYAAGENTKGQCEVYSFDWTDPSNRVVMIAANATMTVGLREDGTIITTLNNINKQINKEFETNRDDWGDIVYISVGGGTPDKYSTDDGHIVAITGKGKAIGVGHNAFGQIEFDEWDSNMVFASAGLWHTLGIKVDRTIEIKVAGANKNGMIDVKEHIERLNPGTEMLYVSAGFGYSLGLTRESDGTLKLIHAGYDDFDKKVAEMWNNLIAYPEWERFRTDELFRKMVLTPISK